MHLILKNSILGSFSLERCQSQPTAQQHFWVHSLNEQNLLKATDDLPQHFLQLKQYRRRKKPSHQIVAEAVIRLQYK